MEALIPRLVEQGGMFALAVLALTALNRLWQERLREVNERLANERADKLRLAEVLSCNTEAITELAIIVRELKAVVQNGQQRSRTTGGKAS